MAVLMIGEVPNLTEEVYGGMIEQMKPRLVTAKGSSPTPAGPTRTEGGV
jgi:hypothetical protein